MFNGRRYKVKDEVRDSVIVIEKDDSLEASHHQTTLCKRSEQRSCCASSACSQEYPQGMTENINPILIALKTFKEMSKMDKVIYFLPFLKNLITSIISTYKSI